MERKGRGEMTKQEFLNQLCKMYGEVSRCLLQEPGCICGEGSPASDEIPDDICSFMWAAVCAHLDHHMRATRVGVAHPSKERRGGE